MQTNRPKAIDLFQAYYLNGIPSGAGFIITGMNEEVNQHARFEIFAYHQLQSIHLSNVGLTFKGDARKKWLLKASGAMLEPKTLFLESGLSGIIPPGLAELDIIPCSQTGNEKIMVSKQTIQVYTAFTILKPGHWDFAFLFYDGKEVLNKIQSFLTSTLNSELQIPEKIARNAANQATSGINID